MYLESNHDHIPTKQQESAKYSAGGLHASYWLRPRPPSAFVLEELPIGSAAR